jgi:hypothetical protein
MSEQEFMSPPFATDLCTPRVMHRQLDQLENWVNGLRYWANEESRGFEAPEDPFIPDTPAIPKSAEALMGVTVPMLFRTWNFMRAIRERWDWIYRTYEEDWDSRKCIFHRVMCVKVGALVLRTAFLDPETQEAKQEEGRKQQQEQMVEMLKSIGIPDKLLKAMGVISGEEAIDFDKLFNPDEDED